MSKKIAAKTGKSKRAKHQKVDRLARAERRERQQAQQAAWIERWTNCAQTFLESLVNGEVSAILGRPYRAWGNRTEAITVSASCNRCGRTTRGWFRRNGTYPRTLVLPGIAVAFRVPRLRCHCGSTVDFSFSVFAPSARISPQVEERFREGLALGMTLRQIGEMTAPSNGGPPAKSTINARGQDVTRLVSGLHHAALPQVPPVVLVDGIWVKVLVPTGEEFVDRKGRTRPRVRRAKMGLLVAFGVDPTRGEWWVLDWERATEEDQASWERLLERLRERGLHAEKGLRLVVSDGSAGLKAALAEVDLGGGVQHQLCVFHRLRNIGRVVKGLLAAKPNRQQSDAAKEARREQRRVVVSEAAAIYQGKDRTEVLRRRDAFVARWQEEEPEAVATLLRDFEHTIAYLDVQEEAAKRGEIWDATYLRTTSRLERLNRTLRRMVRQVVIFHAEAGLESRVYLTLMQAGEIRIAHGTPWTEVVEDALAA